MIDFIISINDRASELDGRQSWKIRYPLSTILFLVFVCQLAGIETWKEMEDFIEMNEPLLGTYVDLSDGCPSHDTLERVVSLVNSDRLKELKVQFEQSLTSLDAVHQLISVDGKTIRGNRGKNQKPVHIVTAYDGGHHLSLGQVAVEEKSNEIVAIPQLLRTIDIRKSIVTIDAMGTQTAIVDTIIKGKADYCLAVKGNQETLYDDIALYFSDINLLEELQEKGQYYQTVEKARGQIEVREYWVSSDIKWLCQNHPKWHK